MLVVAFTFVLHPLIIHFNLIYSYGIRFNDCKYAAASAAVQNVLLSLHAEGIGSKWATGPVIRTPAFRQLIQALPTDRIAALIMLGGSTEFVSEREAQITAARRGRRRSIHGDLVVDLS